MMDSDPAELSIDHIKGVGPARAEIFSRLGIITVKDALFYLPYRYEDRSKLKKISDISPGSLETVRGKILSVELKSPGRRFKVVEVTVSDGTGSIKGKWFNQPFLKKNFRTGEELFISGFVKTAQSGVFEIQNPEYEFITDDSESCIHTNRIAPIYRLTEGISQKQFRKIMYAIVNEYGKGLKDAVPAHIVGRTGLPSLNESIAEIHFPENEQTVQGLRAGTSGYLARLAFEELFFLELGMAVIKSSNAMRKGLCFDSKGDLSASFLRMLHFTLTSDQERALGEILRDMSRPYPMHRLLQGDVGCGKTVVAFLAMLEAVDCGYQAVLMAPTQVLAEQHYSILAGMADDLGLRTALISGGKGYSQIDGISAGHISIAVGTHALLEERVVFSRLGLAVIDEQHKFGVVQRAKLRGKGADPHVLVMTATPIPRSLALSIYGHLDCSVIKSVPPGRKPVVTKVFNQDERNAVHAILQEEIGKGRQAYVVYPVIEGSEREGLRSAVQGSDAFRRFFPQTRIGLLHGNMTMPEREGVMASFKRGEIGILVCTTIIEVGVDVPNATVMLVIHAERFGLAQLHQLRGRVGRGGHWAYCLLIAYGQLTEEAKKRLGIMEKSTDGFRIAEEDMCIRGPGEFLGARQSGMPDLKVADIIRDAEVLETARREAFNLIGSGAGLGEFPLLRKSLRKFWKGKGLYPKAGKEGLCLRGLE